jgi:protease secretion system membrane fusion protein
VTFHADLIAAASDPVVRQHMSTQQELHRARRQSLAVEVETTEKSVAAAEAALVGYRNMLEARNAQAKLLATQVASIEDLAGQGFAPKTQLLQIQQQQADLRTAIASLQGDIQRTVQSIAELKSRTVIRRQDYAKEDATQLAAVRADVQAGRDKLNAMSEELARTRIVAPIAGQVVGLSASSAGGVVTPGQRLMDIVPNGGAVIVEARVPLQSVDRVSVNQEAQVRFSSFAHSPQLVVDAKVISVSADALGGDSAAQIQPFYLARVEITPRGLAQLGKRKMQPGMPTETLLKTGERSMLTYLIYPLTRRWAAALKEE